MKTFCNITGLMALSAVLATAFTPAKGAAEPYKRSDHMAQRPAEHAQGKPEERARLRPEQPTSKELLHANEIVRQATYVYRQMTQGANQRVPSSVAKSARCVVVIPSMVNAALVVGGAHGTGIMSCRTAANQWSPPAFVSATGGSLGVQMGGTSTDVVLYVMDEEKKSAISGGKFTLGADASIVAGSTEATYRSPSRGIVSYQRSGGAFIGGAITGINLDQAEYENRAMYGRQASFIQILDGKVQPAAPEVTREFNDLLI